MAVRSTKSAGNSGGGKRRLHIVPVQNKPRVPVLGKPVKLYNTGGTWSCGCGRTVTRGMVIEHNGTLFCSHGCAASA